MSINIKYATNNFLEKSSELLTIALAFFIPLSTSIAGILLPLAAVCGLFTQRFHNTLALLLRTPWIKTALFLFVLFGIAISYSSAPFSDALHTLVKYSRLLLMVLLIPSFSNRLCRKYAILGFLTAITITLILSYLQFFGVPHLPHQYGQAAIFKDRIQTNFLMAFSFYLFFQIFIDLMLSKAHRPLKYFRLRQVVLLTLCMLTLSNILFLSDGRSGYIIFSLLVLLLGWQKIKWRGILSASIFLTLTLSIAFILSDNFHDRMLLVNQDIKSYQQGNSKTSVGLRLAFIKNSAKLIAKHPLVGTGTGSYAINPHNEYLNIGVQLGLPATFILLLLFYLQWRDSERLPTQYKEIAQAVILAIGIGCLGNSWLMDTTEGHFYAMFMALCFAAHPRYYFTSKLKFLKSANDPY